ncbi:MAG: toprim domain-containing protein [Pirellulaceae bacterium]
MHYRAKGKDYFALGLLNDSGGYELRNPFWKGSLGSKDITTIPGDSRRVSVFEGLFDYLTALQLSGRALNDTVIVLNSVSLAERAIARIRELDAERINVYRDHDAAGERLLESFAKALPTATIVDKSDAYPGYCDLNEGYLAARKSGKACAAI